MHRNITISDLDVEIQGNGNKIKRHLLAKIGIGIVEFLLVSVLFCYGLILSEYVTIGEQQYGDCIWTSVLFICCWSFTDPVARFISEYFEDQKNIFFRYLIGISTAVLFIAMMIPHNIMLYTIFGGIISNMISTQITKFAIDKLDLDTKIFEAIRQVARALSLFIMPHLLYLIVSNPDYDINQVKLIFAAILLHIVPASLLIKTDENWKIGSTKNNMDMTRYQTIGRFTHQISEMEQLQSAEDDSSSTSEEDETPLRELIENYSNVSNNNDNATKQYAPTICQEDHHAIGKFDTNIHYIEDLHMTETYLNPGNIHAYYLDNGVNILPDIPEEDEESENINYIDPKRLSVISCRLEELNEHIRKDSIKEVFDISEVIKDNRPEPINEIEYISNFQEHNRISVLDELKTFQNSKSCLQCSPYRRYIWTRRLRIAKDFSNDNFIRPLYHSVKNMYFYPSLMTKIIINLVTTLYITLAPFMALQVSWKQKVLFSTENVTFLLTYVAFSWGFFLVGLPLVIKLNHAKIRIVFAFGLLVSGTSLWILSGKPNNEIITISTLLFGFGYGIISYTEKIVFKMSIGMRPWYLIQGTLEVLSALFILLIYHILYLYTFTLNELLFFAAMSYYFNASMWICLPFVKYFTGIVKRIVFDQRSQQEGYFH